jgi:hypothetical protein
MPQLRMHKSAGSIADDLSLLSMGIISFIAAEDRQLRA